MVDQPPPRPGSEQPSRSFVLNSAEFLPVRHVSLPPQLPPPPVVKRSTASIGNVTEKRDHVIGNGIVAISPSLKPIETSQQAASSFSGPHPKLEKSNSSPPVLTSKSGSGLVWSGGLMRKLFKNQSAAASENFIPPPRDTQYGFDEHSDDMMVRTPSAFQWRVGRQRKKWSPVYQRFIDGEVSIDDPIIARLCKKGVPPEIRKEVWMRCSGALQMKQSSPPTYYHDLLRQCEGKDTKDADQIERDLKRTLPTNRHFGQEGDALDSLRRVLLAYSWHNKEVGYCQSMNIHAAILLLFMDEEDAFWTLGAIIERICPAEYYTPSMLGIRVDNALFAELLSSRLPKLSAHFEDLGVPVSSFVTNWFLCLFVKVVPLEISLRSWDGLLLFGAEIVYRVGLAVLRFNERALLRGATDLESALRLLHDLPLLIDDSDKLFEMVYDKNAFGSKVRAEQIEPIREQCAQSVLTDDERAAIARKGRRQSLPVHDLTSFETPITSRPTNLLSTPPTGPAPSPASSDTPSSATVLTPLSLQSAAPRVPPKPAVPPPARPAIPPPILEAETEPSPSPSPSPTSDNDDSVGDGDDNHPECDLELDSASTPPPPLQYGVDDAQPEREPRHELGESPPLAAPGMDRIRRASITVGMDHLDPYWGKRRLQRLSYMLSDESMQALRSLEQTLSERIEAERTDVADPDSPVPAPADMDVAVTPSQEPTAASPLSPVAPVPTSILSASPPPPTTVPPRPITPPRPTTPPPPRPTV